MVLPPAPIINAVNPVGSSDRVPKQNKGQQRWRSGKAPEWAGGAPAPLAPGEDGSRQSRKVEEPAVISGGIGAVMHDATDRRLRRLAVGRKREVADAEILEGGDEDERHGRHVEEEEEEEEEVKREEDDDDDDDESEDGDKQEARRARIRELAKQRRMDEAEDEGQMEDEEVDEEKGESSESWEYETDSDEDAELQLVKPVFVSKTNRATLEERARIEKEEKEEEKFKAQRAEQRKKETRKMVAEELQKEKQAALDRQMRQKREDTDEEGNEEEEYDKWRLRELKRIKRDREERDKFEREKSDTERRRTMTDAQIMADNVAAGKGSKTKGQMVFMQKYHHKGAFFIDKDETGKSKEAIYNRDMNTATDADKATAKLATSGPYEGSKVLQVRRGKFGRMGQTKWTHLTDQDTTKLDSAWAQGDDAIRRKIAKKLGGHG